MQTSLLKPKIIAVESLGESHAKVVMEPFERGYGHTLGNALRRVLLSSMVGYAPTEVTIAGVVHEYSTLDGVQEDVVNLLLNLKGVVFKLHNRDEVTVTLRKEGEGVVTAGDIELAHDCEVINPDHVIAHLSKGGKLDVQIKVEKGRGYVPGNVRRYGEESAKIIGRIVLDASFSPVRRVSYTVESARVEQRTDLDKLVIDIETDGSVHPEEALKLKRRIDASNQKRTDLVEYLDHWFYQKYLSTVPKPDAKINTETPAWAVDRLSILALKIYHMYQETVRASATD